MYFQEPIQKVSQTYLIRTTTVLMFFKLATELGEEFMEMDETMNDQNACEELVSTPVLTAIVSAGLIKLVRFSTSRMSTTVA